MRTVIFIPPLSWQSGGLVTLYKVARALHQAGKKVCITSLHQDIPGLQSLLDTPIPFLPFTTLELTAHDIYLVPESHPNALAPGLRAKSKNIVYVQNWYYMLSSLPQNVHWEQLSVTFIAVSHPVAWFMENVLRLKVAGILPPAIDPCFFVAEQNKPAHIRIAFMPRKNAALAKQMREVALAHLGPLAKIPLQWVELHKLSVQEVAKELASTHIYLATGFPEGFGLPPAESMATGCIPVGFTGFGGWEFMRPTLYCEGLLPIFEKIPVINAPCPLPYALKPNGFFVADGDVIAGGLALATSIHLIHTQQKIQFELAQAGKETASLFTEEQQQMNIEKLWTKWQ